MARSPSPIEKHTKPLTSKALTCLGDMVKAFSTYSNVFSFCPHWSMYNAHATQASDCDGQVLSSRWTRSLNCAALPLYRYNTRIKFRIWWSWRRLLRIKPAGHYTWKKGGAVLDNWYWEKTTRTQHEMGWRGSQSSRKDHLFLRIKARVSCPSQM